MIPNWCAVNEPSRCESDVREKGCCISFSHDCPQLSWLLYLIQEAGGQVGMERCEAHSAAKLYCLPQW